MLLNAFFCVSAVSRRKSSSFNIFSTSVIAFIKCRNRHQMKNNMRYKGSIIKASIIIFLKWYFAWENLWGGFWDVVVTFNLHFVAVSSFCCCSSYFVFLHLHFLLDVIPLPSVDCRRIFTLILYIQLSTLQSD